MVWRKGGSPRVRSLFFPPHSRKVQGRHCQESLSFQQELKRERKEVALPPGQSRAHHQPRAGACGYSSAWDGLSILLTLSKWKIVSYAVLTLPQHCCTKMENYIYVKKKMYICMALCRYMALCQLKMCFWSVKYRVNCTVNSLRSTIFCLYRTPTKVNPTNYLKS